MYGTETNKRRHKCLTVYNHGFILNNIKSQDNIEYEIGMSVDDKED